MEHRKRYLFCKDLPFTHEMQIAENCQEVAEKLHLEIRKKLQKEVIVPAKRIANVSFFCTPIAGFCLLKAVYSAIRRHIYLHSETATSVNGS